MKEPVIRPKHPWLAGVCVAGIAVLYFFLLATDRQPEPGPNLVYDTASYRDLDNIETRFVETGRITPDVEEPRALATGPDGKIYVAGKDALVVFSQEGEELERFELAGTPTCIALSPEGELFLGMGDHIEIMRATGEIRAVWEKLETRTHISSIAVNAESVYLADAGNKVVLHFNREGVLQARIGEKDLDHDVPGLQVPASPYMDVAFDADGALWVVNPGLGGLESYRGNGDLITSWYRQTLELDGFSGCCNPTHIAFRADGRLVTSEKGLVRVKLYDVSSGEFEELVAGSRLFPREQAVKDLAVDANDRILVLDPRHDAIRIFEEKEKTDEQTSQSA